MLKTTLLHPDILRIAARSGHHMKKAQPPIGHSSRRPIVPMLDFGHTLKVRTFVGQLVRQDWLFPPDF